MRVLHVIPELSVGGAERLVLDLSALQSKRRGWKVAIASAPGMLVDEVRSEVSFFPMPGYSTGPVLAARWRVPLRERIDSFQPDVVHTHAIKVTLPFLDLLRRAHVVMTSHNCRPLKDLAGVTMAGLGWCELVRIADSPGEASSIAARLSGRARICTIANGVDVEFWATTNGGPCREMSVVWVGRLVPAKQPELAIDIVERVARRVDAVRLTIVGGGQLEATVRNRAAESPLARRIEITGVVGREQLRVLYSRAKVILSTSRNEGSPLTLLEAAAGGCARVIPALPSLVTDRLRGSQYYEPGDVDAAAARVTDALLSDSPGLALSDVHECEAQYAALYARATRRSRTRPGWRWAR